MLISLVQFCDLVILNSKLALFMENIINMQIVEILMQLLECAALVSVVASLTEATVAIFPVLSTLLSLVILELLG